MKLEIAGTGHRTYAHDPKDIHAHLLIIATQLDIAMQGGIDNLIIHTGGAKGFDTLMMRSLRHFGHHVLHIPFTYQSVLLMSQPDQLPDSWELCKTCGPVSYDGDKDRFQRRNKHMVDLADRLYAYYAGWPGGTKNCIQYAKLMDKPVINIMTGEYI